MKIAVASADGVSISRHFGGSACFIVFDVNGGEVGDAVVRTNTSSAHAKGQCCGHHDQGNHEDCHGELVAALQDCSVVICGGMGGRMVQNLERNGIKPIIARDGCLPKEAVRQYLEGTLQLGNAARHCHR